MNVFYFTNRMLRFKPNLFEANIFIFDSKKCFDFDRIYEFVMIKKFSALKEYEYM